MQFLDLAKKRCSVRDCTGELVEPEKVSYILEAGRVAPTGVNAQSQRILVIQSKEGMEKVAKVTGIPEIYHAPLAILVCVEPEKSWVRKYDGHNIAEIDATIVTDHMILAATEQGLGTLWMCRFRPELVREEFQLPDSYVPVNLLLVGYSAEGAQKAADRHDAEALRKPLSETVSYETFAK